MPNLEINLKKIQHNAKTLNNLLTGRNISIIGVTKVILGSPSIARELTQAGIKYLGDSRINNIIKMKQNNVNAKYVLIRIPSTDEISLIVKYADFSLNSEFEIIKMLSEEAIKQNKVHNIILMVDMGDLREGIDPTKIEHNVNKIIKLKGINISGIGTNLKCFGGIIPTNKNMKKFSEIAINMKKKYGLKFEFVSGGNSANFNWLMSCKDIGEINNLRIGEALFLGHETINYQPIPNLYTDAFKLTAQIIELKQRPTTPQGIAVSNAFGEKILLKKGISEAVKNKKMGFRKQALLNVGRQDIVVNGLKPIDNINVLGASSDYLIIDVKNNEFQVGQKLYFSLNYEALLQAMTSPYINKKFI
ncbi:MAG: alanine/ornithine racemase family PLP-dependent enzyme [Promethearchaeota archaeon]